MALPDTTGEALKLSSSLLVEVIWKFVPDLTTWHVPVEPRK